MNCRVNLQSNPISLIIIGADGTEHQFLDIIGHDGCVVIENMIGNAPHGDGRFFIPGADIIVSNPNYSPIREPAQPAPIQPPVSDNKTIKIANDADRIRALEL